MTATVDNWRGPGSGGPTVAPNTFWWDATATGQTSTIQVQFFNSSGGLVTVSASFYLWDVTAGAATYTNTLSGVNTMTIGPISLTSGHTYTFAIQYNSGTSCNHCICSVTGMTSGTQGHPVLKVRRSGAWVNVSGHQLRVRRAGAWVALNDGLNVRRSNVWKQP